MSLSAGDPAPRQPTDAVDEPGPRFAFGENWSHYLDRLTPERVRLAQDSLTRFIDAERLAGARFLDVGSGSGVFSLAAHRLGAQVTSFDFDAESVQCTDRLRREHGGTEPPWVVRQGSVLDFAFVGSLGDFDVVYSWGVLHHTGDMWRAMEIVAAAVASGGLLYIALYNDQGRRSKAWRLLKRLYVRSPRPIQLALLAIPLTIFWLPHVVRDAFRGNPLRQWRTYEGRGMSAWHDLVDWAGGYPFEVAEAGAVVDFYRDRGFQLQCLRTTNGVGCNEFVFGKAISG